MAAERHEAWDDGGLAVADVAHQNHAAIGAGVGGAEVGVDLLEEPITASEHRVHGDAGHLEEQRLQSDVLQSVRSESHWGEEV